MIRAVFFDAVGTLIHPDPQVAAVYAAIGNRFGSKIAPDAVRPAFAAAFQHQDRIDQANGWRTDETREVERWRGIVAEVLPDVADREGCFAALYDHFGQSENWRCAPAAGAVLRELARRGLLVGIASNFDRRLRQVLGGFADLAAVQCVVISSEVGWRKPAAAFFEELCRAAESAPAEVLYVGDDPLNDRDGAQQYGCQALLLAPNGVAQLGDVLSVL